MVAFEPDFGNAGRIIDPVEVSNQAFLDAEYRVAVDIGVIGVKDMRCDLVKSVLGHDVMKMGRPVPMAA